MSRSNLYALLPSIWKRLDVEGVLERFLRVFDYEFDRNEQILHNILYTRSIETTDDQYIKLLSILVGHEFDEKKSFLWNRAETRNAVAIYSYKGTLARVDNLVKRYGGTYWKHVDMASQIVVPGNQGFLGNTSSYLMGPILYHPGAHQFFIDTEVKDTGFEKELIKLCPAGDVWFITYISAITSTFGLDWTLGDPQVIGHQITYAYDVIVGEDLSSLYLGSMFLDPYDSFCVFDGDFSEKATQ
jgi:phage tail-like protein